MTALTLSKTCLPGIYHLPLCRGAILSLGTSLVVGQEITPWRAASNHCGQVRDVEGIIIEWRSTSCVCLLDFSPNWPTVVTAVMFVSESNGFPADPEPLLQGQESPGDRQAAGVLEQARNHPEEPKPVCLRREHEIPNISVIIETISSRERGRACQDPPACCG